MPLSVESIAHGLATGVHTQPLKAAGRRRQPPLSCTASQPPLYSCCSHQPPFLSVFNGASETYSFVPHKQYNAAKLINIDICIVLWWLTCIVACIVISSASSIIASYQHKVQSTEYIRSYDAGRLLADLLAELLADSLIRIPFLSCPCLFLPL